MPELIELYQNSPAYGSPTWVSEWTNVSSSKLISFSVFSDVDHTTTIEYSVDSNFDIIETDVKATETGGDAKEYFLKVTSRFMRFTVAVASNPAILRTQGFFWLNGSFGTGYNSTGPGIPIFEDDILKTLSAGTGITLNDSPTDIEIVNAAPDQTVTLTPGTGILISGSYPNFTITNNASGSGPYQISADDISPIDPSVNAIVSGTGNVLNASTTNSVIGGSNTCQTTGVTTQQVAILGSQTCNIQKGINSAVISSLSSNIDDSITTGNKNRSSIISCDTCIIGGSSENRSIIASDNCSMRNGRSDIIAASAGCYLDSGTVGGNTRGGFLIGCDNVSVAHSGSVVGAEEFYSGFIACRDTTTTGDYGVYGTVISSTASLAGTGNESFYNSVIASDTCTVRGTNCSIVGGNTCSISSIFTDKPENCAIIGGSGHTMTGGGSSVGAPQRSVIIGGSNAATSYFDDCILMCNGSSISATAHSQLTVKKAGGIRMYSNDLATTGMTMAAGASSWAAVSDINKKENVVELSDSDTMLKMAQCPVYKYNYTGTMPELENYGPTAQDYHSHFGAPNITVPVIDPETGEQATDPVTGDPLTEQKPAKDPLTIELKDYIGLLHSCIRDLHARLSYLEGLQG